MTAMRGAIFGEEATLKFIRPDYGLFALLVVSVVFSFLLPRCNRPGPIGLTVNDLAKTLKPDDRAKTVVAGDRVVSVSRMPGTPEVSGRVRYLPPEGRTEITVKENGEVLVNVRNKGFCFRPGIGVASFGGNFSPVLDVGLAYWNRYGAVVGTGLERSTFQRPYAGVKFQVIRNTGVFVGYSIAKDIVAGVRLTF